MYSKEVCSCRGTLYYSLDIQCVQAKCRRHDHHRALQTRPATAATAANSRPRLSHAVSAHRRDLDAPAVSSKTADDARRISSSRSVVQCDAAQQGKAVAAVAEPATAASLPPWALSGPCLVAAGAFVCSLITLQVKLFDEPVPPLKVAALSSSVAWVATSLVMWASGDNSSGPASGSTSTIKTDALLLLRGLLGAATVTAYYTALEELPLPVAVALFFFHPVLALLLSSAASGNKVSAQAAASCVLSVIGVLVIGWHNQLMEHAEQVYTALQQAIGSGAGSVMVPHPAAALTLAASAGPAEGASLGSELSLHGVVMGLIAAAANAAAFFVVGMIGPNASPLCVCRWQHMVTTHAAVAILLLQFLEQQHSFLSLDKDAAVGLQELQELLQQSWHAGPTQHDWVLLLGVVAANFMGQLLLNAGLQRIDAGRGASVNTLQVLFANVWDVLLLHSQPSAAILVGSGMIAAGVIGTGKSTTVAPPQPPTDASLSSTSTQSPH